MSTSVPERRRREQIAQRQHARAEAELEVDRGRSGRGRGTQARIRRASARSAPIGFCIRTADAARQPLEHCRRSDRPAPRRRRPRPGRARRRRASRRRAARRTPRRPARAASRRDVEDAGDRKAQPRDRPGRCAVRTMLPAPMITIGRGREGLGQAWVNGVISLTREGDVLLFDIGRRNRSARGSAPGNERSSTAAARA